MNGIACFQHDNRQNFDNLICLVTGKRWTKASLVKFAPKASSHIDQQPSFGEVLDSDLLGLL
jgi:hypothetical protein